MIDILLFLVQAAAPLPMDPSPSVAEAAVEAQQAPDSAADANDDESIVVTGEADDDNIVRCRYEKKIGTSIKKKICRTVAQAKAEAEAARRAFSDMAARRRVDDAAIPALRSN